MKRTAFFVVSSLAILVFLTGCNSTPPITPSQEPAPPAISQPAISEQPVVTETVPPVTTGEPQENIPAATVELFGLNEMDAALFEGALAQDVPYSSGAGVTFPYVGVYGQYEEDGKLYVICFVSYQRYDADAETRTLASAGTTNTYGRAILTEKNGTYTCDSFALVGEDAATEKDLRKFCGGQLADLPDKIIGGGAEYTSNYPKDMVSLYCQATGVSVK